MIWKVQLDESLLVKGFYPEDYQGNLPVSARLIEVDNDHYQHIISIMPAVYDEDNKTFKPWIPPPTSLATLKTRKLCELESSFNKRVSGSFNCSYGWPMQFDRSDTLAVEGAIQLLRATGQTNGYLTDANDETHYDVPIETMGAIKMEMLAAYAQCHARKQGLRAAINAAQTEEELNAIEITWPV